MWGGVVKVLFASLLGFQELITVLGFYVGCSNSILGFWGVSWSLFVVLELICGLEFICFSFRVFGYFYQAIFIYDF